MEDDGLAAVQPDRSAELLSKGRVGPLHGFRSKMGRAFEAVVKIGEDKKPQFDFGENGLNGEIKIDKSKHEALGLCPICQKGQIYRPGARLRLRKRGRFTQDVQFSRGQDHFAARDPD